MHGWLLAGLFLTGAVRAEPRLDGVFGDHMVLQRGVQVPVWGSAEPGEKVTVQFAGQTVEAIAGADGAWTVPLAPRKEDSLSLIHGWRKAWNNPELPFYFVQLPNVYGPSGLPDNLNFWPLAREAQAAVLPLPHTGMAVTIDLGDEDLHPRNKYDMARRLAAIARPEKRAIWPG